MSCESSSYGGMIELNEAVGLTFYTPDPPVSPPSGSERRVQLTWAVSRYDFQGVDAVRVRIEASQGDLMPEKIFAYLLLPMKPNAGAREGAFSHVCSPVDLAEYPEDDPIPGYRPEWFRLNYVDVHLRSRAEAKRFIQDVLDDVNALKNTLDVIDTLQTGGTLWIGGPPYEESSSQSL